MALYGNLSINSSFNWSYFSLLLLLLQRRIGGLCTLMDEMHMLQLSIYMEHGRDTFRMCVMRLRYERVCM